ncbi:MAG TPA: response regulator [Spirochaetota bacterium]|nr:response regulator [Spirochaetota bacterium]HPJ36344.1 response regulator [Spirochaetota bacterium]
MGKRKNILLVDDSKVQQKILKSLLEKEGYTLFISENVSGGLRIIGTEDIGLVLIDFYLAGINDGTALVNKIRKYGVDIPVYAISASEENSRELLAAGCDGVLSKDPQEIKKFILSLDGSTSLN